MAAADGSGHLEGAPAPATTPDRAFVMCRNIRPLYHFEPPVTDDEVQAASLQFIRKVSGFTRPSAANQAPFDQAVADVSAVVHRLLHSLVTNAPPKNRETEAAKARARAAKRYGGARTTP
jgi:hypothetical protein